MASTRKFKIVVTRQLPDDHIEKLRQNFEIIFYQDTDAVIPRETLLKAIREADGIFLTLEDKVNEEFLNAAPKMKVVSTMSVGYDHINIPLCQERGVHVYNTPGVLTDTTAEFAITLMMAACRNLQPAMNAAKNGEWSSWKPFWMCGKDIGGSTIGIFGLGAIGFAIFEKMKGFGCKFIYYDPKSPFTEKAKSNGIELVSKEDLFRQSDILTLHCPLLDSTKECINKQTLSLMKKDAILINTSRGPVIHQEDLYEALKNGVIGGAALDVTVPEPLPPNHKLFSLSNCIIAPHIASASMGTRRKMSMLAIDNLIGGLSNRSERDQWRITKKSSL